MCCYLVYAIKHWQHLGNTVYYDDVYRAIDGWLAPFVQFQRSFNDALGIPVSFEWYVLIYMFMFWLTLPVCFFLWESVVSCVFYCTCR